MLYAPLSMLSEHICKRSRAEGPRRRDGVLLNFTDLFTSHAPTDPTSSPMDTITVAQMEDFLGPTGWWFKPARKRAVLTKVCAKLGLDPHDKKAKHEPVALYARRYQPLVVLHASQSLSTMYKKVRTVLCTNK